MSLVELPCPGAAPPSDADLLRRFTERHDRQAAEELIRRHGQLVMNVCRRILGRSTDADDAFQATFLVLLRGGFRLREPRSLAAWLYGTAWRIAVRLRSKLARRQSMEAGMEPHAAENPFEQVAARHDLEVFDAELARLPERYRASLVLHYLEGRSQREIAQTLGATEAAVEGLLKRGRAELRARLARRGVVLTTTLAAVAVQDGLVSAADWSPLVESTIQAATAQSPQAWENASNAPRAETLFQQELKIMWLQKLSLGGSLAVGGTLSAALLGCALLGNGLVVGAAEGPTPVNSEIVLAAAEESAVAVEAPPAGNATEAVSGVGAAPGAFAPAAGGFSAAEPPGAAFPGAGATPPDGAAFGQQSRAAFGGGAFAPMAEGTPPAGFGFGQQGAGGFGGGLAEAPGGMPGAGPGAKLSVPLDQETLDELLERPIQLNYRQVDWVAMLTTLQLNGLPIDIDLIKELPQLGVNPLEKVDLNIGQVSTKTALRLLLKPHGLEAMLIDGKLKIVRAEQVVGGMMGAMPGGPGMMPGMPGMGRATPPGAMGGAGGMTMGMPGGGFAGGPSGPALQRAGLTAHEARIQAALQEDSEVDFVDMPLKEALDFLKNYHDIQIWVDETKLQDARIGTDTPVTLQVKGIPLHSVLDLLLGPQGIDYMVHDDVLKVTSRDFAEKHVATQVFRSEIGGEIVDVLARAAKVEAQAIPLGQGKQSVVILTGNQRAIREFERLADQVLAAARPEAAAPTPARRTVPAGTRTMGAGAR